MYLFQPFRLKMLWNAMAWIGTLALLVSLISYFDGQGRPTFLLEKGDIASSPFWRVSFNLHVLSSGICLATGPVLMIGRLIRWRGFHALLGYIYLNAVLWIAAPTGLLISPDSKGGTLAVAGFILTGLLWWWTTWKGYASAIRKDYPTHALWMVRSYSIALSAVWFRFLQLGMTLVPLPLDNRQIYIASVWLSLLVALLISESGVAKMRKIRDHRQASRLQDSPSKMTLLPQTGEIG